MGRSVPFRLALSVHCTFVCRLQREQSHLSRRPFCDNAYISSSMGLVVSCINPGRNHRHRRNTNKGPDRVSKESITREEWLREKEQYDAALWELARAADARMQRISDRQEQARKRYLAGLEDNANEVSEEKEASVADDIDVIEIEEENGENSGRHGDEDSNGQSVASSGICAEIAVANNTENHVPEIGIGGQTATHDVASAVELHDPREGDTHADKCDLGDDSGRRSVIKTPIRAVRNGIGLFKSRKRNQVHVPKDEVRVTACKTVSS